jgi:hypothetical protein
MMSEYDALAEYNTEYILSFKWDIYCIIVIVTKKHK